MFCKTSVSSHILTDSQFIFIVSLVFLMNAERFCNKPSFAEETYPTPMHRNPPTVLTVPEIFPRCDGFPGHAGVLSWRVATPLLTSKGWWWVGSDEALSPQCGDLCPSSRHQAWPLPARLSNWTGGRAGSDWGAASLLQSARATPTPRSHLLEHGTEGRNQPPHCVTTLRLHQII
jgi:hypothetical protein